QTKASFRFVFEKNVVLHGGLFFLGEGATAAEQDAGPQSCAVSRPSGQGLRKPTISSASARIGSASARARSAPRRRTASMPAGSARRRFISAPISPRVATARSVSTCLKKENSRPPNSL